MSNKPVKYYFGRFNLIANYKDKKEFLLRGLQTKKYISHRKYLWGFVEIQEVKSELGLFIHGYLVKYKPESNEEVVLPEKHKLGEVQVPNTVEAKSRFFMHVNSGLLAYHPVSVQIENEMFCERFVEIFQEALDKMFVNAEIQSIEDQFQVLEIMQKFSSITKVEVYLHPSNPNLSHLWKNVDERIKKVGANNYREVYEATKMGNTLSVAEDEDIRGKIAMAEDGYGEAGITGEINGEVRRISTKDNPITALASGDEDSPENVLENLKNPLQRIFSRFNK